MFATNKRWVLRLTSAFFVFLATLLARASENGAISYRLGVNTVLNGILPLPGGTQFYDYLQFYDARQMAGPTGNSAVPNFKLDVFVEALRLVHTWGATAGPITLSTGVVLPTLDLNLHVGALSG